MPLITYREALNQALREEMRHDERVFLMGEEVGYYQGAYKISKGLLDEFGPQRVLDTPITELGFTGLGVGAAIAGLRPIVEMMTFNFSLLAIDQIVNSAAKMLYMSGGQCKVPMVIRGPSGAGVHGGPYHSQSNEMWFVHTPGLKVVAPATASDAKGLIKAAIRDDNPVIFFEHKFLYRRIKEEVPEQDYVVPIGKAVVRRPGKDITVITYGAMVWTALEAAAKLDEEGISLEVVDLRSLLPYDEETVLASVRRCSKVILLHEDTRTGGMAGELAALIGERAFGDLDGSVVRITAPDTPVPFAPPLEEYFLPNARKVVEAARKLAAY